MTGKFLQKALKLSHESCLLHCSGLRHSVSESSNLLYLFVHLKAAQYTSNCLLPDGKDLHKETNENADADFSIQKDPQKVEWSV